MSLTAYDSLSVSPELAGWFFFSRLAGVGWCWAGSGAHGHIPGHIAGWADRGRPESYLLRVLEPGPPCCLSSLPLKVPGRFEAEISRGGDKRTVRGSCGDEPVKSATMLPLAAASQRLGGRPGGWSWPRPPSTCRAPWRTRLPWSRSGPVAMGSHSRSKSPPARRDRGRRAEDQAAALEPPVQRGQVHPGGRPDQPEGWADGRHGPDCSQRYWHRHRPRGPGGDLRRVPPGGERRDPQAGGHGAWSNSREEIRRAARGPDLGRERARPRVDLHLHAALR